MRNIFQTNDQFLLAFHNTSAYPFSSPSLFNYRLEYNKYMRYVEENHPQGKVVITTA